jgi:hypothetical protein
MPSLAEDYLSRAKEYRRLAEREGDRWSAVNAAANAIYLAVGERRRAERISAFDQRSRGAG